MISSPTAGLRSCGIQRTELVFQRFTAMTGENGG
jgi:hypothetical protein